MFVFAVWSGSILVCRPNAHFHNLISSWWIKSSLARNISSLSILFHSEMLHYRCEICFRWQFMLNFNQATTSLLSDPFVKVQLVTGLKLMKTKKTSCMRGTIDPCYNESFSFRVPQEDLCEVSLVFTGIVLNMNVYTWKYTHKNIQNSTQWNMCAVFMMTFRENTIFLYKYNWPFHVY